MEVGGQLFGSIPVRRGVRQGDPLSPILFNLIIDIALRSILTHIGYRMGGQITNALTFADDVCLMATTTESDLQEALQAFESAVAKRGLILNPDKSLTMSQIASGREKKVKSVPGSFIVASGVLLPFTTPIST